MSKPKILLLDIETAPLLSYTWGTWDQNIGLNQIHTDTCILSWAAKWYGESKVMYKDQRDAKDLENEKAILQDLWKLMDEAHVIVGHNSKKFDVKRINARFLVHGMRPPSSYKQIDTLTIAKKFFAMTSNKLEYLCKKLNCKIKKLTVRKFSGFELWKECLDRNKEAWKEMQKYNIQDVLALEELYNKLIPWDKSIDFNVYNDNEEHVCSCGSKKRTKNGWDYTKVNKYQRYKCNSCGKESRSRKAFKKET